MTRGGEGVRPRRPARWWKYARETRDAVLEIVRNGDTCAHAGRVVGVSRQCAAYWCREAGVSSGVGCAGMPRPFYTWPTMRRAMALCEQIDAARTELRSMKIPARTARAWARKHRKPMENAA